MKASAILLILLVVGVAGAAAVVFWGRVWQTEPEPTACTLEAKICPDGSAVGRTGPNCEFADCPPFNEGDGNGGEGILPYNSGVRGTVLLGPTCPVVQDPPDPQCADKPYQTAVSVFRASDTSHAFATVQAQTDGSFEISLPPGEYIVEAAGNNPFPWCSAQSITVEPDAYVEANISCDTGIR